MVVDVVLFICVVVDVGEQIGKVPVGAGGKVVVVGAGQEVGKGECVFILFEGIEIGILFKRKEEEAAWASFCEDDIDERKEEYEGAEDTKPRRPKGPELTVIEDELAASPLIAPVAAGSADASAAGGADSDAAGAGAAAAAEEAGADEELLPSSSVFRVAPAAEQTCLAKSRVAFWSEALQEDWI